MSSSFLLDPTFWAATAERTIRTAAQIALALIGTGALGITDVDWPGVASASALAAVACVLTCIAAGAATKGDGPSLGPAESTVLAEPAHTPLADD